MLKLAQYGLDWSINTANPGAIIVPDNFIQLISTTKFANNTYTVSRFDGKKRVYKMGKFLGEGSYGKVYECMRGSKTMIVKEIKTEGIDELKAILLECIVQIIVVKETEESSYPEYDLVGPFAPRLFDFGYDETEGKGYIFAEQMHKTVRQLAEGWEKDTAKDRGEDLARVLLSISVILSELFNKLSFNHRDFKTDNCMYVRDEKGYLMPRLIDFGFSCIKYKNLIIDAKHDGFRYCSLEGRDMSQFIYECVHYYPKMSKSFLRVANALLTMRRDSKVIRLLKGEYVASWRNTYRFFNNQEENPNGHPGIVKRVCEAFLRGERWEKKLAYPRPILGPSLHRVPVLPPEKPEPEPAKPEPEPAISKACPPLKPDYNPKTKRCVKKCPDGKKRDGTFKCVKQSSANTLLEVRQKSEKKRSCPPLKPDYNPKTKRCVKGCPSGQRRNATFKCRK